MNDLGPDQVRGLAAAVGLPLDGDDLAEVTHRLNAFVDALGGLAALDLSDAEPSPALPPDASGGSSTGSPTRSR
jgi:hypothetical protein